MYLPTVFQLVLNGLGKDFISIVLFIAYFYFYFPLSSLKTMKWNHIDVLMGKLPRKSYIENQPLLVADVTW